MKKTGLALYMIVGVSFVISGFVTNETGLKEENINVLERVSEEYQELGDMGFEGYCPLDYKVAFSNGEKDVVVNCASKNSGYDGRLSYKTSQRPAVYEGLAASIYQNGDEYEVVVPEYDTWSTLETLNNQTLSAVIWHEGFHAYQNTKHKLLENLSYEVLPETELSQKIDADAQLKTLFTKELEILSGVTGYTEETLDKKDTEITENTSDIRKIALEYLDVRKTRDELLDDKMKASESFYDMMEGTAYYVESKVACYENGEESYRKNYLDNASEYAEGGAKYYRRGMLECMLLDKLDPEWKASYGFDRALSDVIEELVTAG